MTNPSQLKESGGDGREPLGKTKEFEFSVSFFLLHFILHQ